MATIDKRFWRVAIDNAAAGELTIRAAEAGMIHYLVGFFLVAAADGTFEFNSDTIPQGAGVETSLSGVCKMKDGVAVGFRGEKDAPPMKALAGEALVLETVTAAVSGFFYGFTEGA